MSPHTKQFIIHPDMKQEVSTESELDQPLQCSTKKQFKPHQTVIVFDLHGVVFKTSIRTIIKSVWSCPNKLALFRLLFNPHFIYDLLVTVIKKRVIEQGIYHLAEKYPHFDQIKPTAFAVSQANKPIPHTVNLLKKLKEHGYQLVAFSNIGSQSIAVLQKQFPSILNLFDVLIHSTHKDGYISKPSPEAFKKLLNTVGSHKSYIFIDDTATNIEQAHYHNMHSILFINAFILEKSLHQIGVLA